MRAVLLIALTCLVACAVAEDVQPPENPRGAAAVAPRPSGHTVGPISTSDDVSGGRHPGDTPAMEDTPPSEDPVEPACADRLPTGAVRSGPHGLMVQVPSIEDLCELERALDHVCRAHPEIKDLVLTSVDTWTNGRVTTELKVDVLEVMEPYLGCFANVFVGTVSEILLPDPYGAWTIEDEEARWTWIRAARELAPQIATWMNQRGVDWDWYVSYEANLNAFTAPAYRDAYIAMLQQHIVDLTEIHDAVIAWSPTFWTRPSDLGPSERADLASALEETFERVPIDWVLIQDHLGVQPSWSCDDALQYYDMVRAAGPQLSSVQLNVEYFTTDGGLQHGQESELTRRVACYRDAGAPVGASFEIRYWYGTHGH